MSGPTHKDVASVVHELGLSRREVARMLGVNKFTYNKWLSERPGTDEASMPYCPWVVLRFLAAMQLPEQERDLALYLLKSELDERQAPKSDGTTR